MLIISSILQIRIDEDHWVPLCQSHTMWYYRRLLQRCYLLIMSKSYMEFIQFINANNITHCINVHIGYSVQLKYFKIYFYRLQVKPHCVCSISDYIVHKYILITIYRRYMQLFSLTLATRYVCNYLLITKFRRYMQLFY